ncbi:MAG: DUF4399 domain-containing protein [Xenococcaceae cyanobacterium MO_207.B15]|nr:DUF4399 domain-containing protein [Xenococcaceae cyanobacterium MO_207.B15]MDJ0744000.1 DUF4399 domain-containing protein [Xenococcaceae cyanobacterium MO_167.B27]
MKLAIAFIGILSAFLFGFGLATPPMSANELVSPAPDDAQVYIISPADGDTLPNSFQVQFGLSGMGIAPAGIDKQNTGHHHLLVDLQELPDLSASLPATEHIRHFGGGQTETTLTLPPGEHKLQLLLGNYAHIPHERPILSDPITVTVK